MTRRRAYVLLAAAAWTVYVWVTRIVILAGERGRTTGFKVVHFGLAAVSIAFAVAIAWIALAALSAIRQKPAP